MNNCKSNSKITKTAALGAGIAVASQIANAADKTGLRDVARKGPPPIRVGLVGCGGRGLGAANDCAQADKAVQIYALGDMFPEKIKTARANLRGMKGQLNVTDDRCFTGFDAYLKVINSGVDYVLFATPPGFRPSHLRACIEAGKHAFIEKPVAVDPAGVRSVIETADLAAQKNAGILAGTQYRHDPHYLELIKRLHAGDIGDILVAQCYFCGGGAWSPFKRKPEWTDMEYQIRNWYYYTWLSGDFIVEQHVHNLDVMNWALRSHPIRCLSLGGRQARTGEEYGQIFDHFTTLYEYSGGLKVLSMCRQIEGSAERLEDRFVGAKGTALAHGLWTPPPEIKGEKPWKWEGDAPSPYVQEHKDMINSIRAGKPLNEGRQVAESTLTAIMGRMSAYTGQSVTWDFAMKSKLNLFPDKLEFGPHPVDPVALPGKTPLI